MTRLSSSIDYTSKDFDTIRADCILAIQRFVSEWTDHSETDFGIVLIDLFSGISDILHYYIDDAANEAFLPTAVQYENVRNLLKLIDYNMSQPTSSSVPITFSLAEPILNDINIPLGQRMSVGNIQFNCVESGILSAGNTQITSQYSEGKFFTEQIGISDGSNNQSFPLSFNDWVQDSLVVWTEDNILNQEFYTKVDTFVYSGSDDKVFDIRFLNEKTYIIFGNGVHGHVPDLNTTIFVKMKRCNGKKGNIGYGLITNIVDPILDNLNNSVDISAINLEPATGGEDKETIDHAKFYGPKTLRTLWRAVTEEDYTTLASAFKDPIYGSIGKAFVTPEYSYYVNRINIFVVVKDINGFPINIGTPLKNALKNYIETIRMATTEVIIKNATFKPINLTIDVKAYSNYKNSDVKTNIINQLNKLFLVDNMDFGGDRGIFALSDIYGLIEQISGVDYLNIADPINNLAILKNEFPTKGTFTINVTGGAS